MIDFELENELRPHLTTGERLLWTGKPKSGLVLRSSDAFLIPFSLLWGGFAIFWEYSVLSMGISIFMLWGIPFVLIGLHMMVGRFFTDAYRRGKTVYGITDNRIIIKTGLFSQEIKSLNIKSLADLTLTQKTDNSGTITLGPVDSRSAMLQGVDWPGAKQTPCLDMIEDVKSVYEKIVALQRQ